jgi:hypothetical protein
MRTIELEAAAMRTFARGIVLLVVSTSLSAAPPSTAPAKKMSQVAHREGDAVETVALEAAGSDSPRIAAAIARLRLKPAPAGEAFALIKVTDRQSGERVMLTRGTPDPSLDAYVSNPSTAPPEFVVAEQSTLAAEDGVEIAIRSMTVAPSKFSVVEAGPVLSEDDEELLRLRDQYDGGPLPLRIDKDLRQALTARARLKNAGDEPIRVAIELRNVPHVQIPRRPIWSRAAICWRRSKWRPSASASSASASSPSDSSRFPWSRRSEQRAGKFSMPHGCPERSKQT